MVKVMERLKEYEITGTVKDNSWLYANKEMLESYLRDDMRDHNILPLLDVPVNITCSYNEAGGIFEFTMVAPGVQMEEPTKYMGILINDGLIVGADAKKVLLCDEF